MSTPAIQATLQQMQGLASQAANQPMQSGALTQSAGHGSFGGELQASIQRINQLKLDANNKAMAFQAGDPDVELGDVMVDMQKASVASQMGLQVRNRLVSAYRDVMNMQV
ncbi:MULTISPECIES: flagellar hook-basal body complex protein FliE [unclassified Halomonas]|uniref:flagellar hook-basal body complex protein FliE n=1 Tax=unclassified Halomonas TaxID=2609666 RepID=UPI0006DAB337|nr:MULTISPECIES: flagellar hook-basal body complex protein FliE [unclassified Halomonas]KPQ22311.1 MAG: flagellar hook-basal body complex protein FliE [Halomonas sp. HL-93]SBR52347.1 flagellar hook-basal body complex protein FliE [Halomonas sp. HL-93]SNY98054.1 flagellar hook-basal body complex protein FliE [Halomonas sp. hl-4]